MKIKSHKYLIKLKHIGNKEIQLNQTYLVAKFNRKKKNKKCRCKYNNYYTLIKKKKIYFINNNLKKIKLLKIKINK
jgi:hypothetical protein